MRYNLLNTTAIAFAKAAEGEHGPADRTGRSTPAKGARTRVSSANKQAADQNAEVAEKAENGDTLSPEESGLASALEEVLGHAKVEDENTSKDANMLVPHMINYMDYKRKAGRNDRFTIAELHGVCYHLLSMIRSDAPRAFQERLNRAGKAAILAYEGFNPVSKQHDDKENGIRWDAEKRAVMAPNNVLCPTLEATNPRTGEKKEIPNPDTTVTPATVKEISTAYAIMFPAAPRKARPEGNQSKYSQDTDAALSRVLAVLEHISPKAICDMPEDQVKKLERIEDLLAGFFEIRSSMDDNGDVQIDDKTLAAFVGVKPTTKAVEISDNATVEKAAA